jgi:hypothetical protein
MTKAWPAVSYDRWGATCDTLHAHAQVLGKLSLVVALDLHSHHAVVEHSDGQSERVPLTPDRPVADVTSEVLAAVTRLGGHVRINPMPQEVAWGVPLDEDYEHARYDEAQVADYFAAVTQAALALAEFSAPYRGRSTPVNAWWGSFDRAVTLYSGAPADPPGDGFITRNASDAEQMVVGWWPGDAVTRMRRSTPSRSRRPRGSRTPCSPRLPPAGMRTWASSSWTGTTYAPPGTRGRRPWSSLTRRSGTPPWRVGGAPNSWAALRAAHRPSGEDDKHRRGGRRERNGTHA